MNYDTLKEVLGRGIIYRISGKELSPFSPDGKEILRQLSTEWRIQLEGEVMKELVPVLEEDAGLKHQQLLELLEEVEPWDEAPLVAPSEEQVNFIFLLWKKRKEEEKKRKRRVEDVLEVLKRKRWRSKEEEEEEEE